MKKNQNNLSKNWKKSKKFEKTRKNSKQFIEKILKKSKSQIIFLSTDKEIDSNDYYGIKNYISKTYLIKHNKIDKTSKIVGKSYFVK